MVRMVLRKHTPEPGGTFDYSLDTPLECAVFNQPLNTQVNRIVYVNHDSSLSFDQVLVSKAPWFAQGPV